MMIRVLLSLVISVIVLSGCASGPEILTNVNPQAKISDFNTYGFFSPLGTDRSNGTQTTLSGQLMDAMSREMAARGMVPSDSPDILIDFLFAAERRTNVRSTPITNTVSRSHWSMGVSTWPNYHTQVSQYKEGTLIIDFVDTRGQRLLAEGAAQSRIENSRFTQEQVNSVVGQIVQGFWPK